VTDWCCKYAGELQAVFKTAALPEHWLQEGFTKEVVCHNLSARVDELEKRVEEEERKSEVGRLRPWRERMWSEVAEIGRWIRRRDAGPTPTVEDPRDKVAETR